MTDKDIQAELLRLMREFNTRMNNIEQKVDNIEQKISQNHKETTAFNRSNSQSRPTTGHRQQYGGGPRNFTFDSL